MKINIKALISQILIVIGCLITLYSCEFMGLPVQKEYPYDDSTKDPRIFKNAYQFVQDRSTRDMSLMYAAIQITGLQEEYEKDDRTFLILNDAAFTGYMTDKGIPMLITDSLRVGQIDSLSMYLRSNIAFDRHTSLTLPAAPYELDLVYQDENHRLFLNRRVMKPTDANKYQLYVNDFPGTKRWNLVRTTNIEATNGIIHVVNNYPEYQP